MSVDYNEETGEYEGHITRADLEAKLGELKEDIDGQTQAAKPAGIGIAVGAAVVVLGLAFVLGKRKGKKRATFVEITRV